MATHRDQLEFFLGFLRSLAVDHTLSLLLDKAPLLRPLAEALGLRGGTEWGVPPTSGGTREGSGIVHCESPFSIFLENVGVCRGLC